MPGIKSDMTTSDNSKVTVHETSISSFENLVLICEVFILYVLFAFWIILAWN